MLNDFQVAVSSAPYQRARGQYRSLQPASFQFCMDVVAVICAVLLAHTVSELVFDAGLYALAEPFPGEAQRLLLVLLLVPVAKALSGFYPGYGMSPVERVRRHSLIFIGTLLVVCVLDVAFNHGGWFKQGLLAAVPITVVLVWTADIASRTILVRLGLWGRPCVVVGAGSSGIEVVRCLERRSNLGYNPVLFMDDDPDRWGTVIEGLPVIALGGKALGEHLARHASTAIVALPPENAGRIQEIIRLLPFSTVLVMPPSVEWATINTRVRDLSGRLCLEVSHSLKQPLVRGLKRAFDIAAALMLLILVLPLMVVIAVALKLDSHGPVLFRQKRWTGGAQSFMALKFRTMHVDAEDRLRVLLQNDPALRREYEMYHKLSQDPRVTRIGRFLRKVSLDELPQLWNVLVGDMSLIGPRPYMPHELTKYPEEQEILAQVKPGITGLWQVSGRHRTTFKRRIEIDVHYVENYSVWLDLYILLRTVWIVLKADGA
jgi:Undecaprenyl-phosphate galactose phosphotransferase WbaP